MRFQLYTTLIRKDNIVEIVAKVLPGKVQSLLFIHCMYELAICASPECPPQHSTATKNGPHCILVKRARREIGLQSFPHLLFHQFF